MLLCKLIQLFFPRILSFIDKLGKSTMDLLTFTPSLLFSNNRPLVDLRLLKLSLDMQYVEDNEEISDEEPTNAGVLINNLPGQMKLNVWKFLLASITVHRPADLYIEVDGGASAAIAVDEEAPDTAGAGTTLHSPRELSHNCEEESTEMQHVDKAHQLHTNSDALCLKPFIHDSVFTCFALVLIPANACSYQGDKLNARIEDLLCHEQFRVIAPEGIN